MSFRERLAAKFLERMIASPEGRAHLLHQLADAEGNGENGFFETLLQRVDHPDLARMVRKHKEDELRHEQLFLDRARAQGVPLLPIPDAVKYVDRIFAETGYEGNPLVKREELVEAYAMLQAIEERSVTQFAIMATAFGAIGDHATAEVFREVMRDEARHIKYCQAVARRYTPDDKFYEDALARMRAVEARCFVDNGKANLEHAIAQGHFQGGAIARFVFRSLQWLGSRNPPLTPFATRKDVALLAAPVHA